MSKSRVVITIDEVIVDGVAIAVPHPALVQHALEREVRRLIGDRPIDSWRPRSVDRVESPAAPLTPTARAGDFASVIATRIVDSAASGRAAERGPRR